MTAPLVSICIATYNHAAYIYDCIMSVIAQSQDIPIEILIGDDQSDDSTGVIAQELASTYPDRIIYIRNPVRLGPSKNYQNIIRKAQGGFIAHLDGDDYWLPGKLKAQIALLQDNKHHAAVYTNALCITDEGELTGVFNNKLPTRFDLVSLLCSGNFLNQSSMMYRSDLKEIILAWDHEFIDYQIHLNLALHGSIGYINKCLVAYRVASSTSMIIHQGERVRELYFQAIQSVCAKPASLDPVLHALSDFLRRDFYRAIRVKSPALYWKWWKVVSTQYQEHKTRLMLLTIKNIVVTLSREVRGKMAAKLSNTGLKVIYWR